MRIAAALLTALLALVGVVYLRTGLIPLEIHVYPNVNGPAGRSEPGPPVPARWQSEDRGESSRLAVLLTDPDSAWLGIAQGLRAIGVPFTLTDDYRRALRHRVILMYPEVNGRRLSAQALQALAAVPRNGGTLIATNVLGGGLEEVFGFSGTDASRARTRLHLDPGHELAPRKTEPHDLELRLSAGKDSESGFGTHAYLDPARAPVARYEDGKAAIVDKAYARGRALAFGFDLGFYAMRAYTWRAQSAARAYVNGYEPHLDVLLRLISRAYRAASAFPVTLHPVPEGRDLAVVLSHDVDYTRSLRNSLQYAERQHALGLPATYFIQTKYVRDWNDDIFMNEAAPAILTRLRALGMEIASHSVAHSRVFDRFELGDGAERYPDYRPFVIDRDRVRDGTVLGELRVSKFLLEWAARTRAVVSFRPGHLANPRILPQALAASGYRYSSSVTANTSLSHLPFRLTHNRDFTSVTPVFEFPITIEDEKAPRLDQRLDAAVNVARSIARDGGLCMVLIHPDVTAHKLEFMQRFIDGVRSYSWFGTVQNFGDWWAARDRVSIDVSTRDARHTVRIIAPDALTGLTLEVPDDARLVAVHPAHVQARAMPGRIVLARFQGEVQLRFD